MLWSDGVRANSKIRTKNIEVLEKLDFIECGLYSTSGLLYVAPRNYGAVIVFGVSCNIGGKKGCKYFSLCKRYKSLKAAKKAFKKITTKLSKKEHKNDNNRT